MLNFIVKHRKKEKRHREKKNYNILKKLDRKIRGPQLLLPTCRDRQKQRPKEKDFGSEPQNPQLNSLKGGFIEILDFFICFYSILGLLQWLNIIYIIRKQCIFQHKLLAKIECELLILKTSTVQEESRSNGDEMLVKPLLCDWHVLYAIPFKPPIDPET